MENKEIAYLFVIISLIVLNVGLLISNIPGNKITSKEVEINSNCNNLTLEETSVCLRDWVITFYNYTIRNDTIKDLEDIKLNGGDCFDYTMLYKKYLDDLGFRTKVDPIFPDNKTEMGHSFLIAWDKELSGYCKLDLLDVQCLNFKKTLKNDTI